jgi:hypothetical protein
MTRVSLRRRTYTPFSAIYSFIFSLLGEKNHLVNGMSLMIFDCLSGTSVCNNPEHNPCTYITYCTDVQGSASCSCPHGMSGDGRKMGSGCQKTFPRYTVLGNLSSTLDIQNYIAFVFMLVIFLLMQILG